MEKIMSNSKTVIMDIAESGLHLEAVGNGFFSLQLLMLNDLPIQLFYVIVQNEFRIFFLWWSFRISISLQSARRFPLQNRRECFIN